MVSGRGLGIASSGTVNRRLPKHCRNQFLRQSNSSVENGVSRASEGVKKTEKKCNPNWRYVVDVNSRKV